MKNNIKNERGYMKYLITTINIILGLFLALTAILLIFAFSDQYLENVQTPLYSQYIGLTYIILLYITIIILLIGSIIGAIHGIKKNGIKSFAKETALSFLGTMVLVIILSLLLDKKVLNTDKMFIPFVSLIFPSLGRFFALGKK